ncbi:hypothetical protein LS684_20845 (plasmid) [Cytobacillus spongiae]|uniref:hypothetical protein n=1 Tax=Cytobacillus spongiae TaxID=2901381 RepID=UPI001F16F0B5|nr:hypothetical protein [Cytobacillus spongiae]UII58076.1 hypothetical protein LS684_20845 [Cytobacillus spongiae]
MLFLFRFIMVVSLLTVCFPKAAEAMPDFNIEIVPWEQVEEIIPNRTYFTIIDVETGLSFKVQRRAGNKHADVQPVTKKDTKIMKSIYGGKWSWDRRAILVLVHDQLIAASMNGMPHGAGALQNDFPGHFCVHFYGSTTHKTPTPDLGHKIMILKAGGVLDEFLYKSDPYELIRVMEIAVNQHDERLLSKVMSNNDISAKEILHKVRHIEVTQKSILPVEDLPVLVGMELQVSVKWIQTDQTQQTKSISLIVRKEAVEDQWKLDGQSFLSMME